MCRSLTNKKWMIIFGKWIWYKWNKTLSDILPEVRTFYIALLLIVSSKSRFFIPYQFFKILNLC